RAEAAAARTAGEARDDAGAAEMGVEDGYHLVGVGEVAVLVAVGIVELEYPVVAHGLSEPQERALHRLALVAGDGRPGRAASGYRAQGHLHAAVREHVVPLVGDAEGERGVVAVEVAGEERVRAFGTEVPLDGVVGAEVHAPVLRQAL